MTLLRNKPLLILLGINSLFIAAHLVIHVLELYTSTNVSKLVSLLSMDLEYSLPTFFAVLLLASIATLFLLIGIQKNQHKLAWFSLSAIFAYLSLDELLAIHEQLIEPMQAILSISSGPFFFAWIIPVSILIIVFTAIYWKFLFSLPKNTRNPLFLAATLFILGAIGVEMISGAYWQAHNFDNNFAYRLLNALEEGLENTGSIIALIALIKYKKMINTAQ